MEKPLTKRIDELVVGCALDLGCDEAELVHLAIEYAHEFRRPYVLPHTHMRSLETLKEQDVAKRMEAKVNKVIAKTIRREGPMGAMSRLTMERFAMQPRPNPHTIMQSCKCKGSRRSPTCKMPAALCKATMHALSITVPRTRKSAPNKGGKKKSRSSKRRL